MERFLRGFNRGLHKERKSGLLRICESGGDLEREGEIRYNIFHKKVRAKNRHVPALPVE